MYNFALLELSFFAAMEDPKRLYISGLPYGCSQERVRAWLRQLGVQPQSMYLHRKDVARVHCSGFLRFTEDATEFVPLIDWQSMDGFVVRCVVAQPKRPRKLGFISKI